MNININNLKDVLNQNFFPLFITSIFTLIIYSLLFHKEIDLKVFLLLSFLLPFSLTLITAYNVLRTSQKEYRFLISLLKMQEIALVYILTVIFFTLMSLFLVNIKFTFAGILGQQSFVKKMIDIVAYPWASHFPDAVPSYDLINQIIVSENGTIHNSQLSSTPLAYFILLTIMTYILFPRILILFWTKKKIAFYHQKSLNKREKNTTSIEKEESHLHKNVDLIEKRNEKPIAYEPIVIESTYLNESCIVYYKIDENKIDLIHFNFLEDPDLKDKSNRKYFLGLFGQEKEEKDKIIENLKGLVVIFVAPSIDADNAFKDLILRFIENQKVIKIWVVPLEEIIENTSQQKLSHYRLLSHFNKSYSNWDKQIYNVIASEKVRLFNER